MSARCNGGLQLTILTWFARFLLGVNARKTTEDVLDKVGRAYVNAFRKNDDGDIRLDLGPWS